MESVDQPKPPEDTPQPPYSHDLNVLAVCDHGRTRSLEVKNQLREMGYDHAGKFGIKDPQISQADKLDQLISADIIITTQDDVLGIINHLLKGTDHKPLTLNLPISEKEHHQLGPEGLQSQRPQIRQRIVGELTNLGFTKKDTH